MRVGLLIYGSLDTLSGGYLYDRQLVNYLETKGDKVEVVSTPWRNYVQHLLDNFSGTFFRKLAELELDILIQDELNHPSLFYLNRKLKQETSYPLVSIVHHLRSREEYPDWQRTLYATVEKRYLQSIDGFIFNSESTRKDVEKSIEDSIDGVVAYPAGNRFQQAISHEMIRVRAQQDIPLQILFLGNVIPRKSLHILLAALRNIADKEWFLSVVGSLDHDAKYAHGIMQVVKSSGISKKVIFYGSLVEEDLEKILRKSHVMAVPSYHEGFGIVYLEGMAFGLPAIATTSGGAAEIITHEENGFLIPRDDVELLSEYLSILIENREILSRMGMAALDHFHQHPSWVESMSSIRDFLDHMIQKRVSQ